MFPALRSHLSTADWLALFAFFDGRLGDGNTSTMPRPPKFALLSALAGDDCNRRLRVCGCGLAAITWFISPQHLIGVTAIIPIVLWHRDVRWRTLSVMAQ